MAGLAVAFPISIGIALVVGTVLSYALQPKGNAVSLALGVVCAFIAVLLDGKAYGSLASAGRSVSKKSLITCVVSGILMGLWAPFMTHAMTRGNPLGPYSAAVFLTLGALLSCFIWNIYFMKHPLVGEPVSFAGFFSGPASGPSAGPFRRIHLGHWHGFQSSSRKLHRRCDLLCHRPVCSHGCRALGNSRVEGIRKLRTTGQNLPGTDVHLLWAGNFPGRTRQRLGGIISL